MKIASHLGQKGVASRCLKSMGSSYKFDKLIIPFERTLILMVLCWVDG